MRPLRVLILEPEPAVARALERTLEREVEVTLTHHPGEALEWLASGLRFDAILSAVMMRYLTGPEFFVRARHIDRASSRRIVFHSGGVGGKEHEFLRSIPNRFVAKPADRTTLLAAIHDAAARGDDDEMT